MNDSTINDSTDPTHTLRARAEIDHAIRGIIDALTPARTEVLGNDRVAAIATTLEQLACAVREALTQPAPIPPLVREALERCLESRDYQRDVQASGSFVRAVLNNDLRAAVLSGDAASVAALPTIVRFVVGGRR